MVFDEEYASLLNILGGEFADDTADSSPAYFRNDPHLVRAGGRGNIVVSRRFRSPSPGGVSRFFVENL